MSFNRVANDTTIVREVLKQLTTAISQGMISPGEKIPTELELMAQLGVGRNSVREAVKMLSALGVLEVKRGSGTFVTREVTSAILNPLIFSLTLERKTAQDLNELRLMFEMMAALILVDKIADQDMYSLEQMLAQEQRLYEQGQGIWEELVEMERTFYQLILQFTYNPLIQRIGKAIMELYPEHLRESLREENAIARSLHNRRCMVEAIREKDKLKVLSVVQGALLPRGEVWQKEMMPGV